MSENFGDLSAFYQHSLQAAIPEITGSHGQTAESRDIVICLMGPTASGKTKLAIELTCHLPCDIISVDSAMVYREMDIGTAKPTPEELSLAPHQLINLIDPAETYSAGRFCTDAHETIAQTLQNGRIPLLVGGTMLYFKTLQTGLSPLPTADPLVRQQLSEEIQTDGLASLYTRLQKIDPIAAERIKPNDTQRIQRALEVHIITGKSLTECFEQSGTAIPQYHFMNIGLCFLDKTEHWKQIELRLKNMLEKGFKEEVVRLKSRADLHSDMTSMRTVGYKEMWAYLDGELSEKERDEKIFIATRQLAKRQITWLRAWPNITFLEAADKNLLSSILKMTGNFTLCRGQKIGRRPNPR